jgi:2-polyprenyl-3-methyl-5-hydroxy-6-metoxy-1,4-benzoquinol methylase
MATDLEAISDWYSSHQGIHARVLELEWGHLEPLCRGTSCLELGSADGGLTVHMLDRFARLLSIDGSAEACRRLEARYGQRPELEVRHGFFESVEIDERFETIILDHVLEHLADPGVTLKRARRWLSDGGCLIVTVPNADSLHRLLGVKLGMIPSPHSLNELDQKLGHHRVYDPASLAAELTRAGWKVVASGGMFLKLFSNGQMEAMLASGVIGQEQLQGLSTLATDFPDHASEIYAVAELA